MRLLTTVILTLLITLGLAGTCMAQTNTGNLINETGSTIVGADSSGSGSGDVLLQTKGLTGFRLRNDGNAVVSKKLGINTTDPQVPLHFTVNYPANTTQSETMIMFTTPTGTDPAGQIHTPFEIYQRSTTFGDDRTDSVGIGFAGIGGSQGVGNFGFLFEDVYGSPPQAELHLIFAPFDNTGQHRPWTWAIDRQTGFARVVTKADSSFASGSSVLQVLTNQILNIGRVRHQGTTEFETATNGGAPAKQIRMVPFALDPAQTVMSFGGLVSLGNQGLQVAAFNADGSLGAFKGGRFATDAASIDNASGVVVGNGSTLRFASSGLNGSDVSVQRSGYRSLRFYDPNQNAPTKINASFDVSTVNGAKYHANGVAGVTVSGSSCVITQITAGIITAAVCTP